MNKLFNVSTTFIRIDFYFITKFNITNYYFHCSIHWLIKIGLLLTKINLLVHITGMTSISELPKIITLLTGKTDLEIIWGIDKLTSYNKPT